MDSGKAWQVVNINKTEFCLLWCCINNQSYYFFIIDIICLLSFMPRKTEIMLILLLANCSGLSELDHLVLTFLILVICNLVGNTNNLQQILIYVHFVLC